MELQRVQSLSPDQIDDLLNMYRNEWWSTDRSREDVERMLRETDEVVAFADSDGSLVAFARALTDYVYRAMIYDVVVHEDLRGEGVSDQLIEELINHPRLTDVEHLDLQCLDEMQGFYERHGFEPQNHLNLMRHEPRTRKQR